MDVDVVDDTSGLDALEAEWRRLDVADPRGEFYTTFDCVRGWWEAYGRLDTFGLRVLVARQNGAVVGILPLALRRRRSKGREVHVLRFASHGDWMAPVLDPAAPVATVVKALLAHVDADDAWDRLQLDHIRAGSHLGSVLLASDRWNRHLTHQVEHPRIPLAGVAGIEAFERDHGLPSKTRKYRNKLVRDHDVRFVVHDGDDADMFHRLGRLHVAEKQHLVQDAGRDERHSWYEDPQRRTHYERLFATPGAVRTFCYESPGGELLAARSTFRHRDTLLSWTSAYDPALRDYRLGKVIQYDVLDHVLADGDVAVFDFGSGRYPWKFEWTEDFDHSYTLRVERRAAPEAAPLAPAARGVPGPAGTGPQRRVGTPTGPGALARGAVRTARSAARRLVGLATGPASARTDTEVWYLARPGHELLAFGAALADVRPDHLVLVHAGVGLDKARRRALDAELREPLPDDALAAAVRAEVTDAAAALGVSADRTRLADGGSRAAGRAVIAAVVREHPRARHRVAAVDDEDAWVIDAVREAAQRIGATVDVVTSGAAATPESRTRRVADAYRKWDPDAGRYAVNRAAASRYLTAVGLDPADPRAHDL